MALGAKAGDAVGIVLAATAVNVGAGLAAGMVLSLVFDKVAARWVTESSRDPVILAGVTLLLAAVAGLACLVPARRAASVDPMEALRDEEAAAPPRAKSDGPRVMPRELGLALNPGADEISVRGTAESGSRCRTRSRYTDRRSHPVSCATDRKSTRL